MPGSTLLIALEVCIFLLTERRSERMRYSVIIPVYDEQDSVERVYTSVKNVMLELGNSYEIVFIDDSSRDRTLQKLKELATASNDICVISLADHVGQSGALQAGFDMAHGEIYITLDGDGQDEPQEIPKLLDKMAEGYDVVCGWRRFRQDNFIKKSASTLANLTRRALTRERIHDVGCALRVFRKKDIQSIRLSRGFHRFFSFIMEKKGYSVAEIEVIHHRRKKGVSKYGVWNRLGQGVVDLFLMISIDPSELMAWERQYKIKQFIGHRISEDNFFLTCSHY